jgi:hypothetical protein
VNFFVNPQSRDWFLEINKLEFPCSPFLLFLQYDISYEEGEIEYRYCKVVKKAFHLLFFANNPILLSYYRILNIEDRR